MSETELWKKISVEGKLDPAKHIEMMNKMIQLMAEKGIKPASLTDTEQPTGRQAGLGHRSRKARSPGMRPTRHPGLYPTIGAPSGLHPAVCRCKPLSAPPISPTPLRIGAWRFPPGARLRQVSGF